MAKRQRTILIVEDDPSTAALIGEVLADRGYHLLVAREGAEALRMIREQQPQVITLDLALPGIDGRSFLMGLRSDETTKRTPVIVVSANSESLNGFERRAVTSVLPKPFEVSDLLAAIESAVDASQVGSARTGRA